MLFKLIRSLLTPVGSVLQRTDFSPLKCLACEEIEYLTVDCYSILVVKEYQNQIGVVEYLQKGKVFLFRRVKFTSSFKKKE